MHDRSYVTELDDSQTRAMSTTLPLPAELTGRANEWID